MQHRLSSNDIAKKFYNPARTSYWLTRKQAEWLYGQALYEANGAPLRAANNTPQASGMFHTDAGEAISWQVTLPRQGGGAFKCESVTARIEEQERERAALERGRDAVVRAFIERGDLPVEWLAQGLGISVQEALRKRPLTQ